MSRSSVIPLVLALPETRPDGGEADAQPGGKTPRGTLVSNRGSVVSGRRRALAEAGPAASCRGEQPGIVENSYCPGPAHEDTLGVAQGVSQALPGPGAPSVAAAPGPSHLPLVLRGGANPAARSSSRSPPFFGPEPN